MACMAQQLPPFQIQPPFHLSHKNRFQHPVTLKNKGTPPLTHVLSNSPSPTHKTTALTQDEIPPNALRRKQNPNWRAGFSLGVDLGMSRTGVALSKGFSIRPLTVLELRGQKLELRLLEIAEQEEADEFIIGLPKSIDGKETSQSNIVRSIAGRFAVRAAERGWRVYLQNEHGTSTEALDLMIDMGLKKSTRQEKIDAYAAMMVLERYFSMYGEGIELVLPKDLRLQEKLQQGPPKDLDFFPGDLGEHSFTNASGSQIMIPPEPARPSQPPNVEITQGSPKIFYC